MSEQPATGPGPAPRPGRWSLRRRLRSSLALVAVLLVVVLAVTAVLLSQVRAKQDRVLGEDFSAIALSDRLYVQLVQAESGVRGYLLTGEPRLLDALDRTSSPRNSRDTATLRRLIAGDDRVVAALHRAQVAAGAWYQGWALPTVAKVRAGGPTAVTPDDVARGDRLFGTVRTDYGRYQTALLDSRSAARRSLQLRTSLLEAVVGIVAAGVVLLGAELWLALRRWVLRPLQDVAAETRSVRSGGLHNAGRFSGLAEFEAWGV